MLYNYKSCQNVEFCWRLRQNYEVMNKSYEQKRTSAVLKNAQKSHLLKPESRECFLYIALNLPGQ